MKLLYRLQFTFVAATVMFSCAPKIEEKPPRQPIVAQGPRFRDLNLSAKSANSFADAGFASKRIVLQKDLKSRLEKAEHQYVLGDFLKSQDWTSLGHQTFEGILTEYPTSDPQSSVYIDIVNQKMGKSVSTTISTADRRLQGDLGVVIQMIRSQKEKYFEVKSADAFAAKIKATKNFIDRVISQIPSLAIMSEFKTILLKDLKSKTDKMLGKAEVFVAGLNSAPTVTQVIQQIDQFIAESKIELDSEMSRQLNEGRKLGQLIDQITEPKKALQTLAYVWTILDADKRVEYIKSANTDLYGFFAGKTDAEMECLVSMGCNSLFTKLALNIGVYPAIESAGVENIKNQLNEKALSFIISKVNETADSSLSEVSEKIISEIDDSVSDKREDLKKFTENFGSILTSSWRQYLHNSSIQSLNTFILDKEKKPASLSAQSLFLRNKFAYLTSDNAKSKRIQVKSQFEVVELLLRLPDFTQPLLNSTPKSTAQLILNPEPRQFVDQRGSASSQIRLENQSQALLAAVRAIKEFSDWKQTSFDQGLANITADQIITQFSSKELKQPFFSKVDLLALALSVASESLKLLQEDFSPVILIDNEQRLVTVKEFSANPNSAPLALAAATDFYEGKRVALVKTQDLNQFLIALTEFYRATAEIEKTKSEILRESKNGAQPMLKQVVDARKKIKSLIVALGNFISNQLLQENGLVKSEHMLIDKYSANPKVLLEDQVSAVEALVKTYEVTRIEVYLWSAMDIYFSMNRHMYDSTNKFYTLDLAQQGATPVSDLMLLKSYRSLMFLKPYLGAPSQEQFENIFDGWLSVLQIKSPSF